MAEDFDGHIIYKWEVFDSKEIIANGVRFSLESAIQKMKKTATDYIKTFSNEEPVYGKVYRITRDEIVCETFCEMTHANR